MKSWTQQLCLLFGLVVFALAEEHWDYHEKGPSTWGKSYPTCNGNKQSPLMLNREEAAATPSWLLRSEGISINFLHYDTIGDGVFTNNGHSVSLNYNYTESSTQPRVVLSSPSTVDEYTLQSIHFHWQSEHWIDHQRYPLEMHMVHKDKDGQLLVLGYVFVACERSASRWFSRSTVGMENLASWVTLLTEVGDAVNVQFAPQRVMPPSERPCGYFAYTGSLTTPPCTEGVTWLVRELPMCADEWQLDAFYSVHDATHQLMAGNARPPQRLNRRSVLYLTC